MKPLTPKSGSPKFEGFQGWRLGLAYKAGTGIRSIPIPPSLVAGILEIFDNMAVLGIWDHNLGNH